MKVLEVRIPVGEVMGQHHVPSEAVITTIQGEADLIMGERTHRMVPGDTFLIPAGLDHSVKVYKEFKAHLILPVSGSMMFG